MRKSTLYITAIVLLVILNLLQLAANYYQWFPKTSQPARHEEGGEFVLRRLQFEREQADQFKILIDDHKIKLNPLKSQLYRRYAELYGLLKTDSLRAPVVDSLQGEISRLHLAINSENLSHFEEVKGLCTKAQLENYDFFIDQMLYRLGPE